MYLPQIAALPKMADRPVEPDRAAQQESGADGFRAVFGKDTPSRRPVADRAVDGSETSGAGMGARDDAQGRAVGTSGPRCDAAQQPETGGDGAQGNDEAKAGSPIAGARAAETPTEESRAGESGLTETWAKAARTIQSGAGDVEDGGSGEASIGEQVHDMVLAAVAPEAGRILSAEAANTTDAPESEVQVGVEVSDLARRATGQGGDAGAAVPPGVAVPGTAGNGAEVSAQIRDTGRLTVPSAGLAPATAMDQGQAQSGRGGEDPALSAKVTVEDAAIAAVRGGDSRVDPRLAPSGPVAGSTASAPGVANGGMTGVDVSRPGQDPARGIATELRSTDPAAAARSDGVPSVGAGGAGGTAGAGQSPVTAAGLQMQASARTEADTRASRTAETSTSAADPIATPASTTRVGTAAMHPAAMAGMADNRAETGATGPGGGSGATGAGEGLFGGDAILTDSLPVETRGAGRSAPPDGVPVLQSPQTPRSVALQIAEVIRASGERAVELRLQPEELGRVQMTLSQDATGTLTVALAVERAETLDLLRRNIDLLGADLRELGYENVDFSFQGDFQGNGTGDGPRDRPPREGTRAADTGPARPAGSPTAGGTADRSGSGIDIRL